MLVLRQNEILKLSIHTVVSELEYYLGKTSQRNLTTTSYFKRQQGSGSYFVRATSAASMQSISCFSIFPVILSQLLGYNIELYSSSYSSSGSSSASYEPCCVLTLNQVIILINQGPTFTIFYIRIQMGLKQGPLQAHNDRTNSKGPKARQTGRGCLLPWLSPHLVTRVPCFPPSHPEFKHQHECRKKNEKGKSRARQRRRENKSSSSGRGERHSTTRASNATTRASDANPRSQAKKTRAFLLAGLAQSGLHGAAGQPQTSQGTAACGEPAEREVSPSLSHTRESCISRRHVVVVVAVQLPALLLLPVRRPPPRPPRRRVLLQQPPDERQHPVLPRGTLRRAQDGPEQQAAVAADGGAEGADVLLGVRAGGEARGEPAARGGLGGGGRGDGEGDGDGVRGPPPGAQGGPARRQEGGVLAQPGPPAALHLRQGLLPRRGVVPPHLQLLPPWLQRRQARPAPRAAPRRRPRQQHVQRRRRQRLLHHVDIRQASIDRAACSSCCVISHCVCVLSSHRLS